MTPIRIEAEDMNLTNYRLESGKSPASGDELITLLGTGHTQGSATTQFNGPTGTYQIKIGYFDESDGQAQLSVDVGEHHYSWTLDQDLGHAAVSDRNHVERVLTTEVAIEQGELISIAGIAQQDEWARVDYIEFIPVATTSPPSLNPGTLAFETDNFSVSEDGTSLQTVKIVRSDGTDGVVSATVKLNDGTATSDDYNPDPIVVNFADGETEKTVTIPIVDDPLIENSETLNLS